eukprot:15235191-Ditylum_brightwellii.AAC.1
MITAWQNEIRDKLGIVGTQSYSQAEIHSKPYAKPGQNCCQQAQDADDNSPVHINRRTKEKKESDLRGDLSIR